MALNANASSAPSITIGRGEVSATMWLQVEASKVIPGMKIRSIRNHSGGVVAAKYRGKWDYSNSEDATSLICLEFEGSKGQMVIMSSDDFAEVSVDLGSVLTDLNQQ